MALMARGLLRNGWEVEDMYKRVYCLGVGTTEGREALLKDKTCLVMRMRGINTEHRDMKSLAVIRKNARPQRNNIV